MQQFAAPKSRPWATACGARIAHLAAKCCQMLPNAAKCWKNAGKFFPDVRDVGLYINLKKYKFLVIEVKYLRQIITTKGVYIDPKKVYIITKS